jgi:hypothetical protein
VGSRLLGHRILLPARFEVVPREQVPLLLRRYWSVPERQIETSVVLAETSWLGQAGGPDKN